jgi:hypothetical protein
VSVEVDTGEIQAIRAEISKDRRRDAYFYLVLVITMVLAGGTSAFVSVTLNHRSERKLCAVVINADDSYREREPVTPAGKLQAANFSRLRHELGCPPYQGARNDP